MSSTRTISRQLPLATALDAHCASVLACRRCAHAPGVQPITVRTRTPRAMLVGQAPGKTEAGGGRPFAGRAGATLFKWLQRAGVDEARAREELYISAVTRCYPGPHPSGRGDRVPAPSEREKCGSWLDAELRIIRPPFIILVGRLAIDRFLGAHPLDELVGREHHITHPGGTSAAIPLPHPSGASSWVHIPEHKVLLDRALELIRRRFADGARDARGVA
jgi:uracil-DNA glycosylase